MKDAKEYKQFFKRNPELVATLASEDIQVKEAVSYLRKKRRDFADVKSRLMGLTSPITIPLYAVMSLAERMRNQKINYRKSYLSDLFETASILNRPNKYYAENALIAQTVRFDQSKDQTTSLKQLLK